MRRILVLCLLLFSTGCANGVYSGTLVFDGDHHFGAETDLPGDVALRAGTAEFAAGSHIAGSLYVVGGALQFNGSIDGDLVVIDGRVDLGSEALIGGDLRVSGGTTGGVEAATVRGDIVTGLALPETPQTGTHNWEAALRWLVGALVLAGLGGIWAQRRPQPLIRIADATTAYWPVSAALGLLALLVLPVLLVMMAFTIVLIPLVFVVGLGIFLGLSVGIVALGDLLGRALLHRFNHLARGWATFFGTLACMGMYGVPLVGEMLLGVTTVLVFGAVVLTRFGTHPYRPPEILLEAEELASYQRT